MDAKAVDFVSCTVSDLGTSVGFYRDTLGLTLEYHNEDVGWAEFGAPPTTIALGELRDAGHEVKMDFVDTGVCDRAMAADPDGNPIMLHRRHDDTHGRKNLFEGDE